MATWISHFRIADYFIDKLEVTDTEFIIGNIGPDCGEPNEDWSEFTPSSSTTHWTVSGRKSEIDSEAFYAEYLSNYKELNKKQYSFYIGYYIHLLTDIEFTKRIGIPKRNQFSEMFKKDSKFIWVMKKDWYDIDHLFLRNNPDFKIFMLFSKVTDFPNVYLDYYSQSAITKQIKYITNFYKNFSGNLDRDYPYLTESEMDHFIKEAICNISIILNQKGLL